MFVRPGWFLACLAIIFCARDLKAQTTFRGTADEVVTGVYVSSIGGGDTVALPAANNRLGLGLSLLSVRSKWQWLADARMTATLEPEYASGTADGSSGGSAEAGEVSLGSRLSPSVSLGVGGKPGERLYMGLYHRYTALTSLTSRGGIYASGSTSDTIGTSEGGTSGELPDTGSSLSGEGETNAGSYLSSLPQDTWTMETGGMLGMSLNERINPNLGVRYRMFRQFKQAGCEGSSSLDPVLPTQNVDNDTVEAETNLVKGLNDTTKIAGEVRARREMTRPTAACAGLEGVDEGGNYNEVVPGIALLWSAPEWSGVARVGGTFVWGVEASEDGSSLVRTGLRMLPTGTVDVGRKYLMGDIHGRAGLGVAALQGQASPTYNLLVDGNATYRPRAELALKSGISLLRTFLLHSFGTTDGQEAAGGATIVSGRLGLEWRPRRWFAGNVDYGMAFRMAEQLSSLGADDTDAAGGYYGLIWHTLSISANFALGGGFGSDWLPRFSQWQ